MVWKIVHKSSKYPLTHNRSVGDYQILVIQCFQLKWEEVNLYQILLAIHNKPEFHNIHQNSGASAILQCNAFIDLFNTIFSSSHVYPENLEGIRVIERDIVSKKVSITLHFITLHLWLIEHGICYLSDTAGPELTTYSVTDSHRFH